MSNTAPSGPGFFGGTQSDHRGQKRRGVTWASDRAVSGVLQWIDDAEASGRTWARNALAVIGVLLALLVIALKTGLVGG